MPRDDVSRRDFLKIAGTATVAATSTAGCTSLTGGGGEGGTLVYARGDHPTNYDPQQTTSGEVAKVTNQIFDTLIDFEPGSGGKLVAGLAKEWSLDGTTATLTLNEGTTFHNGEEVTAADVKATIRRFTDSEYEYFLGDENRSGYASVTFGNWVKSIDASSDYEVTIELTQQYAPFLRNLAMFAAAILSKAQIEDLGSNPDDQATLGHEPKGTGPFQFDELDNENQRVKLSAYDDFWGDGPNVDGVVFKTIGSNQTRAQDVINGDTHITDNLDSQSLQQIQNSDAATTKKKDGINVGYMAFNMARKEAFRKTAVRQAVHHAVNRQAIVDDIYQGFATIADQPLPPDVLGHNEDLSPYETDKDKAQSLLEEAGETDLSFELATFSNPRGYNPSPIQTAEQIKSDLEAIGVTVEINQFSTFSSYIEYTYAGKHDAALLGWYTDNADPDNFLYVLLHPGIAADELPSGQEHVAWENKGNASNISAWANPDFMKNVSDGQKTYDEAKRKSLYTEANKIAHEESPWMWIDYAQLVRGIHESVNADSYTVSSVGGPYLELVELN